MGSKLLEQEVWGIVSTDRTVIASGNVRDRRLVKLKDAKRLLTYTSKGKAESAYKNFGFWKDYKESYSDPDKELEAVKLKITVEIDE